jgi:streptogramin lyase
MGPLGRFSHIPETDGGYGLILDKDGNCWYAEFKENDKLGKIDANTLKVTTWAIPTLGGRPRRLTFAPDGSISFAEFTGGKIRHFDPQTGT